MAITDTSDIINPTVAHRFRSLQSLNLQGCIDRSWMLRHNCWVYYPRLVWILRYKFKILCYNRQRTSLNVWIVVLSLSCLCGKYFSCSSHFIVITLILVIWAIILSVPYGCLCTNSLAIQHNYDNCPSKHNRT